MMKTLGAGMMFALALLPKGDAWIPSDHPAELWRELAGYSTVVLRGTVTRALLWVERPSRRRRHVEAFEARVARVRVDDVLKGARLAKVGHVIEIVMPADMELGWAAGDEFLLFLHAPPRIRPANPLTGWMELQGTALLDPDARTEVPFLPESAFSMAAVSAFQPVTPTKRITAENREEIAAIIRDVRVASDLNPPSVGIAAPAAGDVVAGTVALEAYASDDVEVASVGIAVDGRFVGGPIEHAPYRVSWTTNGVADGPHSITATATDSAGNRASSVPVVVIVDNSPPRLTGRHGLTNRSSLPNRVTRTGGTGPRRRGSTAG